MTQYELFEQDPHPAIALYRFWNQVLEFLGRDSVAFGTHGWGLTRCHEGVIGFGQGSDTIYPHFHLAPDGRFKWGTMHGSHRRRTIAMNVPFLGWGYTHSRYQWFVSFDPEVKRSWYGSHRLLDWQNPHHYVSEDLLGCRNWRQSNRWCELKRFPGEWRIMPSTYQTDPWNNGNVALYEQSVEDWAKYERIIQRRYLRAENQYRLAHDMPPKTSVRTPTVRSGGQTLQPDQAVSRLLALLETERPAKTTPLKRLKEATHGNHNLAPTNHV